MTAFFEKSYKNTRTKISAAPYGAADIFMLEGWDSKDSIQPAGGRLGSQFKNWLILYLRQRRKCRRVLYRQVL